MATAFLSRHSPEQVFRFYRDEVPVFGSGLPGVDRIEDLGSTPNGLRIHRWFADTSRFPALLTRALPRSYFEWTTEGSWDEVLLSGEWTLNIGVFGEGTHIRGRHLFVPDEVGTRVEVDGEVLLDAHGFERLAGLPLPRLVRSALNRLIQSVFDRVVSMSGSIVEAAMERSMPPVGQA